jgi:hypothetical protein
VMSDSPPERANLTDALHLLQIYEAYCQPDSQVILFP